MIEKEFADIIQKIAEEKGKDIFFDPKKLKPLLSDYSRNEYKKERDLFLTIAGSGSADFINKAENLSECKQFLVKRLEDDFSFSPNKSAEMLDVLFLVLRGETYNEAQEIYNHGKKYFDNNDYDNAIKECTEAIRLNSNDDRFYNTRGMAYLRKGQINEVIKDLKMSLSLNPANEAAKQMLEKASKEEKQKELLRRGDVYYDEGNFDQAIEKYTEAIELDPNVPSTAPIYYLRGLACIDKGEAYKDKRNYDLAINDLTIMINRFPNNALVYRYRGFAYMRKGDHDNAIEDFTVALRLNPKDVEALHNRGMLYVLKNEIKLAVDDFDTILTIDPNNRSAQLLLEQLRQNFG